MTLRDESVSVGSVEVRRRAGALWRDAYHELLEDERDGLCEELA